TNRARLAQFFAEAPRQSRLAWEPLGLWQRAEIRSVAEELGVIACIDPLQHKEPLAKDGVAYYRVRGLGGPLGARELGRVLMACEGLAEAYVVFAHVEGALAFLKLVAEL